jgi:hypothetical protein
MIFGQTIEDFNDVIDFSVTLGDLDKIAMNGDPDALPSNFVIIEGAVASRIVINSNAAEFVGELQIVGGEWKGVEEVVKYECVVVLAGPEFASAIPARRSRRANPNEIGLNTRILVVAKAIGLYEREDSSIVPVLQAYYIRKIQ